MTSEKVIHIGIRKVYVCGNTLVITVGKDYEFLKGKKVHVVLHIIEQGDKND